MSDIDQLVNDILGERPKVKDTALRDMINARMKAGGEVKAAGGAHQALRGAKGGEVKKADGGAIGKNVGRGMAGLRRSRQELDPREIQAMMLDVPAGLGVPFAEAGAEYLRGNIEDAKTSAAIDTALTAVPAVGALAKPAYRAVKGAVQKAAPAVREAARGALESGMESGLVQGPSYVIKPSGGQWLGGHKGDTRQIDVSNAPAPISDETMRAYVERLEDARNRAREYTEMTGFEPKQELADRIRTLEADIPRMQQSQAIRNWVDSNLNNYVRKQMGTPDDPVRRLADEGILHMPEQDVFVANTLANEREAAGFPRSGMATTGLGRMWESLSDPAIKQIEAGKLRDFERMSDIRLRKQAQDLDIGRPGAATMQPGYLAPEDARDIRNFTSAGNKIGYETMMANNPWLAKVDPSTPIYKIASGWAGEDVARDLGFNHIVDVLRADLAAGRIRPEQLSKMSMEQAVRRTHEYDLERAAAMAKALEEEAASMSVAKTFDDGFKIVQLDKPGQFAKESDRMGHSVRGYEPSRGSEDWIEDAGEEGSRHYGHGGWEAIKSGEAQVFSIRDAKNQPHVTIEVAGPRYPGDNPVSAFNNLGKPFREAQQEAAERIGLPEAKFPPDMSVEQRTEMQAKFEQAMQDIFAEHGGKLQRRITQIKGKQNRKPDENYLPYVQQFIREGNYEIAGDLRNSGLIDLQSGQRPAFVPTDAPRYITQAELDHMQRTGKFEPDFKEGGAVQKHAKGGEVHAKDGGDDWEKLKRLTPFYGAKSAPVDTEEEEAKRRLRELEGRVLERDYIEPQKDDLEGMVRRGLRSGLGKVMSPEGSQRSADILTDVASFVAPPMWGYESGQALGRAYEAGRSGDYGEAALEGGLGALGVLPAVPGIGVAARGAERAANIGSTALRRPFTPATLTVEATAPDLGQGTSYGFRQGLNDVLLQDIAAGRKAREGTGVFKSEITKRLETNPMLAVDIPRAGRIGEMAGSNEALRREIAQAGVDLNQEAMAAHRFIPLLTNRPEDASAMLIKTKGGLTGDEIVQLASRLGNEMVVTHNPRLGGVVIYPFGPVGKGGAPEFGVAKKAAQEILGKKGKIQYGVADYDRDRLFMEQVEGDYQRAGAKETSPEKAERRRKLQGLEKFMFPESTSGIPGNVKASPLGGLQPWSRGREYPTHVQGIGTKPDWRAVNYATEEVGQRRPTYAEAEKDREALLERWHRTLPGKVR